jgi:transcriptional regulator with XRE-family HTH domain
MVIETRIRDVRKAKGLTLTDIAERCEPPTTAQTVGRLETGARTVSVAWLNRLAAALDVDPSDLVTSKDRPETPVAALLTAAGAQAPREPMMITPPRVAEQSLGVVVRANQGEYRAGDELLLETLVPRDFVTALNHDVLAPQPAGNFMFGRLAAVTPRGVSLLPLTPGAHAEAIAKPAWIAVVRLLIRRIA